MPLPIKPVHQLDEHNELFGNKNQPEVMGDLSPLQSMFLGTREAAKVKHNERTLGFLEEIYSSIDKISSAAVEYANPHREASVLYSVPTNISDNELLGLKTAGLVVGSGRSVKLTESGKTALRDKWLGEPNQLQVNRTKDKFDFKTAAVTSKFIKVALGFDDDDDDDYTTTSNDKFTYVNRNFTPEEAKQLEPLNRDLIAILSIPEPKENPEPVRQFKIKSLEEILADPNKKNQILQQCALALQNYVPFNKVGGSTEGAEEAGHLQIDLLRRTKEGLHPGSLTGDEYIIKYFLEMTPEEIKDPLNSFYIRNLKEISVKKQGLLINNKSDNAGIAPWVSKLEEKMGDDGTELADYISGEDISGADRQQDVEQQTFNKIDYENEIEQRTNQLIQSIKSNIDLGDIEHQIRELEITIDEYPEGEYSSLVDWSMQIINHAKQEINERKQNGEQSDYVDTDTIIEFVEDLLGYNKDIEPLLDIVYGNGKNHVSPDEFAQLLNALNNNSKKTLPQFARLITNTPGINASKLKMQCAVYNKNPTSPEGIQAKNNILQILFEINRYILMQQGITAKYISGYEDDANEVAPVGMEPKKRGRSRKTNQLGDDVYSWQTGEYTNAVSHSRLSDLIPKDLNYSDRDHEASKISTEQLRIVAIAEYIRETEYKQSWEELDENDINDIVNQTIDNFIKLHKLNIKGVGSKTHINKGQVLDEKRYLKTILMNIKNKSKSVMPTIQDFIQEPKQDTGRLGRPTNVNPEWTHPEGKVFNPETGEYEHPAGYKPPVTRFPGAQIIHKLIKIANTLDSNNLVKEANEIDELVEKICQTK